MTDRIRRKGTLTRAGIPVAIGALTAMGMASAQDDRSDDDRPAIRPVNLDVTIPYLRQVFGEGGTEAELGDYGFADTVRNLVRPPLADNPITQTDREGPFPLIANPEGFDDGFEPGRYYEWQGVELSPETGAICSDGSPYRFFVNRVPNTSNTLFYMEGGGACWDYESCTGQLGIRSARNRSGIPEDYLASTNLSAYAVSPFIFRDHPYSEVKSQSWNLVYVPYCTGDVYAGDRTAIYEDPTGEGEPIVYRHNGTGNMRATTAWLKENLQRPAQLAVTGCSAGSTGALVHYYSLREELGPDEGMLIDDSGPIFPTDLDGPLAENPSLPLHNSIIEDWNLGPLLAYAESQLPGFTDGNMGSVYGALALRYPDDRMGHVHFQEDLNYSSYSYERFYPEIENANPYQKVLRIKRKWKQDTRKLQAELENYPNFGYWFPHYRAFNESHCATIVDFNNGDIQERGLELTDWLDNIFDGEGRVLEGYEDIWFYDRVKPKDTAYSLADGAL